MDVTYRSFGSMTTAKLEENGDWTVKVVMTESRIPKGNTEEETKKIAAQCTDSSFAHAYDVAMNSTLEQFNDTISLTQTNSLFGLEDDELPVIKDNKDT